MEKGGFCRALTKAGVTLQTPFGFADEMRVGLRGMVRRVWGRRGEGTATYSTGLQVAVPVPGSRRSQWEAVLVVDRLDENRDGRGCDQRPEAADRT